MRAKKSKVRAARTWDVGPLRVRGGPGWQLRRGPNPRGSGTKGREVVSIVGGWRADYLLPLIVDVIRKQGYRADSISARVRPYPVTEEEGYRLALAFRLIKRTESTRRAEAIVGAARGFEAEEAYLWYSYLARAAGNGREAKLAAGLAGLGEAMW